ncbi:MAG: UbiA family prenyltransferase [Endomicrobia bacterium]|nr:UbiA family prenyltransferase [Endomicrobiia bacterium]MCL2145363.1 UbiA family prenyltransferase [Endomicrobiia bacterium]
MKHISQNTIEKENALSFIRRFLIYQNERFPFFVYGLMVFAFSFSAMSYSKILRNITDFSWTALVFGTLTAFISFFLLRLFDEFKDAEDDAKHRPYLPVPRGLISFKELKFIIAAVIGLQIIINFFFLPSMLWILALVLVYMFIMAKEFFIRKWLRKHPIAYLISHMMIMPVFDFYTTGLDWNISGAGLPRGLAIFLIVTFLNGVVIEIGRKIRPKEAEEAGVETYSYLWGSKNAVYVWLTVLFITFIFANIACFYAGFGKYSFLFLLFFMVFCSLPALKFLKDNSKKTSAKIETMSGVWTLGMYLSLGGIPMVLNLARAYVP